MATSTTSPSPECSHLLSPNPYTTALAAVILVGILISYLPQHLKIISNGSSAGLSPWWVLLGGLSSIAALGNILVLPKSRQDMRCCKEISGGECAASLLGVAQLGLQWGCFMFIVFLFLTFFPSTTPTTNPHTNPSSPKPPKRRDALSVGITILATILIVLLTSISIIFAYPSRAKPWADILGTTAGVLSMIQYLPQIYFTYTLGSLASLSILTMIIQVPGAFLFAFSLWLRVGWEGWSTWLVFVVTGVLQSVLLGLAMYFLWSGRNEVRDEVQGEVDGDVVDERTGLLGNGSTDAKRVRQYEDGGGSSARGDSGFGT